jgi:signal transduction histidine kinase
MVTRPEQLSRPGDLLVGDPSPGMPLVPPAEQQPAPPAPVSEQAAPRRRRRPLNDAKIRTKVILVLLLPVLVIVSLAGVAVAGSVRSASSAASVERLARFGNVMSNLVDELQQERDVSAIWLSANTGPSRTAVTRQVARTDVMLNQLRTAQASLGNIPAAVAGGLDQLGEQLSQLPDTRQSVIGRKLGVPESQLRYTDMIERLLTLGEDISSGSQSGELTLRVRALAAFSRVKEDAAQELALVDGFLREGKFGAGQYRSYYSALSNQYGAYRQFIALATRGQREVAATTLSGPQVAEATRLESAIARGDANQLNVDATAWSKAMTAKLDRMKAAEAALSGDVLDLAVSTSQRAVRQAITDSALVLLALLVALGVSILLARNIVRPLSRLRAEALATAYERLPAAVQRLRNPDALHSVDEADLPGPGSSPATRPDNELGQLGSAFDAMHGEAVRIALEQATLRRQVGGMVVNLSRRSRAMVNRLLTQLDRMEASEEDPDRLAELFRLDHLATRMRRNDESLLVLAGARLPRQRGEPASLLDVVRAAQSEVEQYTRIDTDGVEPDVFVMGVATDDLAHLLAELMENATQFSPPSTRVTVRTQRLGDGVALQVDDQGIGVVSEELEELNRRLHQAASVEVAADRRLGLFVVGRLAARHGVDATLLRLPEGTRAEVRLPAAVLLAPEMVPVQEEPRSTAALPVQKLLDRPLRPSRMQYWANGGTPTDGGRAPMALPRYEMATAHTDMDGDGFSELPEQSTELPRRTPGALLFPGNMRPPDEPVGAAALPPGGDDADRPRQVRSALSSLRRGVEQGRGSGESGPRGTVFGADAGSAPDEGVHR